MNPEIQGPSRRHSETLGLEMGELNPMGLTGSGSRSQVAAPNHQKQGDHSCHNGQHRQSNIHNGLTHNGQHR